MFYRNSALTAALRAAGEGLLVSFFRNSALTDALRAAGEGLLVLFYRNSALTDALRAAWEGLLVSFYRNSAFNYLYFEYLTEEKRRSAAKSGELTLFLAN